MTMTKQQEFLDTLTNPAKARLKQAVQEFSQTYSESILTAYVYEHYKDEYVVEVMADNAEILLFARKTLLVMIEKCMNNPMVNLRSHIRDKNGVFTQIFYVTEA